MYYFIIPLLAVLVVLGQIDDELSEEAVDLISRIDPEAESESYLYLLGIFAKEGDSPLQVGRNLLAEYRKLDKDESYQIADYSESDRLPLPEGEAFCTFWEEGCFEKLFSSDFDIEQLKSEYRVLLSRSNEFYLLDDYKNLSKPTLHEQFPAYSYLSRVERIKVIDTIASHRQGNSEDAVAQLGSQFKKLRRAMELQDTLVGKLVFLMGLSEVLDVLSVILYEENIKQEEIDNLNKIEKSFYMVAAREFAMGYHMYKKLDKHPNFFEEETNYPGWMVRVLFKPNMSINETAPRFTELDDLSNLSPSEFASYISNRPNMESRGISIRNYVGRVLNDISPDFSKYVAKFNDFESKLALFNQVHGSQLKRSDMHNPYYGPETPEEKNGSLCFSGPLEDERSLRCLRLTVKK